MRSIDEKERIGEISGILKERYPNAECSLECGNEAWKLLVMARLSAQCTDKRVNIVCADLFKKYKTISALAGAVISDVEDIIRPCGLFRTKAKNICECAVIICEKYGGKVPEDMDELLTLPGVGRKIANLIRGDIFGLGGIVADTHCIRISHRLGFTKKADPQTTERTLDRIVPKCEQSELCHRLVLFGREVCDARKPDCENCPIYAAKLCAYPEKNAENAEKKRSS